MKRNLQKPVEGELERLGFFQSLCSKWPRLVDRGNRRIAGGEMTDNITVSREQAGIFFNHLVRWIMGIEFSDTQCGFKVFRRERARIIFEQQRVERFGFDPEILFLAKRHGLRVAEVPVRWSHDSATKVNLAADGILMFLGLLWIRWNAMRGYYSQARKS